MNAYVIHYFNHFTGETYQIVAAFSSQAKAHAWFERHYRDSDTGPRWTLTPVPFDPTGPIEVSE